MADIDNLKIKKKNNESINGKPKVYFCAHHDDFNMYFNLVTDDILNQHENAVIFYINPNEGASGDSISEPDMEGIISEMQLIVIPVTARFLLEDSQAKDVELALAQKCHIPILPLIQERNLDDEFTKVFGELQYLDKDASNQDATALPFEERLKKYLDSVLVNDSTIASIRNAFDAYIFLSYRKKDRIYAQQIMKHIHMNPFCRDIAIWYDEFLTPGENFNDGISEAMNKSRLIALAVTPSLLEQPNYVMDIEYPYAREIGTTILPIEAATTDSSELKKYYDGIDDTVILEDSETLSTKLRTVFSDLDNHADNQESEEHLYHLYYMGLAYLYGIDVETDYQRGIALLKEAGGENGIIINLHSKKLPAAMAKLVDVYEHGIGTSVNLRAARNWQLNLVSEYIDAVNRETSPENWWRTYEGVKKLISLSLDCKDLDGAIAPVKGIFKLSNAYSSKGWDGADEIELECNLIYISVMIKTGITDDLVSKLSNANNVARAIYKDKPTLKNCRMAREVFRYAGKIILCRWNSSVEGMMNMYHNAAYVADKILHMTEKSVNDEYALLTILLEAADACIAETKWNDAQTYIKNAESYVSAQMYGQTSHELDVIECKKQILLSRISCHERNFDDAYKHSKKAYDIANYLFDKSENEENAILFAESNRQIADVLFEQGSYADACKQYRMSKYHYLALAAGGDNISGAKGFFECENRAMISLFESDDYASALDVYNEELKYYKHIKNSFDDDILITKIGAAYGRYHMILGDLEYSQNRRESAISFYNDAFSIIRKSVKEVKDKDTYYAFYEISKKLYEVTGINDYKKYASKIISELVKYAPHIEKYQTESEMY